jgi:hypothetical protein
LGRFFSGVIRRNKLLRLHSGDHSFFSEYILLNNSFFRRTDIVNFKIKRRFFECVTVFGDIIDLCILGIVFVRIISEVIIVNKIFFLNLSTDDNFLALFTDRFLLLNGWFIAKSRTVIDD